MSVEDCINNIEDSLSVGRLSDIPQHYKEYLKSSCLYPKKVWITDSMTGERRLIEVPCGSCTHCCDYHTCEWVTRLYAHLEDFKYCYFVTLTYSSFTSEQASTMPTSYVLDYLKDALWLYDSENFTHHLTFNPCVLVKKHYQNFLKRLRKYSHLDDLSFYLSGEYGGKFGRPHYHILLFSNSPISRSDCVRAWSLSFVQDSKGWHKKTSQVKNSFLVPFGNVDFHNLVENGTITNEEIQIDGKSFTASNCFAYVAKYIGKREYNDKRVKLAYNDYKLTYDSLRWYDEYDIDTSNIQFEHHRLFLNNIKLYETDDFGHICPIFPNDIATFCNRFKPFKECSRASAIGSLYLRRNIEEFSKVGIRPTTLQASLFVSPSYFRRKIKQYLFGLCKGSENLERFKHAKNGRSSVSFNAGNLPLLLADFDKNNISAFLDRYGVNIGQSTSISELLNSSHSFKDLYSGKRYLVTSNGVLCFRYNRHVRAYVPLDTISLEDFITFYLTKYFSALEKHYENLKRLSITDFNKQYLQELLQDIFNSEDTQSIVPPFDDLVIFLKEQIQKDYSSSLLLKNTLIHHKSILI